jgi:transposase-like protein
MTTRRRYTPKQKLAAVVAAEIGGLTVTAEQIGVPKSTLKYWMDSPAFAQFRTKTREDLQDEVQVVSHLAWQRIAESLQAGTMEPRDALFAAEKASSLLLLMSGSATSRTELRDITGSLSDIDIIAAVREADALTSGGGTAPADQGQAEG